MNKNNLNEEWIITNYELPVNLIGMLENQIDKEIKGIELSKESQLFKRIAFKLNRALSPKKDWDITENGLRCSFDEFEGLYLSIHHFPDGRNNESEIIKIFKIKTAAEFSYWYNKVKVPHHF